MLDDSPTSVLLAVVKLIKHPVREQIIKWIKDNYSAFQISVLIIFSFDKVITLQETTIRTIFHCQIWEQKVKKVHLDDFIND